MTDATVLAIVAIVPATVSVLTGVAIVGVQVFREGRQHRWETEDRARIAAELKTSTEALALKGQADQARLAEKVRVDQAALATQVLDEQRRAEESRQEIAAAIAENTTLTRAGVQKATDAYHEANQVNTKIAALGLQRLEVDGRRAPPTEPA